MARLRLLIVDDSSLIERLLTDILSHDPEIQIADTATNDSLASAKLPQVNPNVVSLDIGVSELGALTKLETLSCGATDAVVPTNVSNAAVGQELKNAPPLPKIKLPAPCKKLVVARPAFPTQRHALPRRSNRLPQSAEVLLIGASTGGPKALTTILKKLPADFPLPIVVVQHMPPLFTRHLANRLNEEIALNVQEAKSGMSLLPGQVLIAPGDFHLELYRHGNAIKTALQKCPTENSCRPAVDVLFRSAAKHYGPGCLALVLTGMGQDGLRGAEHIVNAGGKVLAQDEATSVVWGMPRAVVEAGLAESVLPLHLITSELLRRVVFARQNERAVERIS